VSAGWNGHPEGAPDEEIAGQLLDAGRRLGGGSRPVLVAGSDQWALLIAAHEHRLRDVFRFPEVPAGLVRELTSKVGRHDLARRHGLPTPLVRRPASVEEAVRVAGEMGLPVVLKSVRSRPGQELALASDADELVERFVAMGGPGEVVLQELVPGDDGDVWMYNGYFDSSSRCLASFTGRKIRQVPAGLGLCTAGVCQHNRELAAQVEAFLRSIGYRGLVDIDFRRDPRDGLYKVLDVNPRLGGAFRLFVDGAGLDVVRAMYLDLTGRPVPACGRNDGRKWLVESGEVIALRRYRRERGLTIAGWVRSLRGLQEAATFSASDPLPFLVAMWVLAADTLGGRWRHLLGRLRRRATARFGRTPERDGARAA
jgi:predicted ATP-grasp superfamily ATP-dependent carboligase